MPGSASHSHKKTTIRPAFYGKIFKPCVSVSKVGGKSALVADIASTLPIWSLRAPKGASQLQPRATPWGDLDEY
jgi:hypothetical protein